MHAVTSNAVANLRKLVWTNPTPSSHGAQTITFDESAEGYSFFEIEFSNYNGWRSTIHKIPIGEGSQLTVFSLSVGDTLYAYREITSSTSTTMAVENGMLHQWNNTVYPDSRACTIKKIYAVK